MDTAAPEVSVPRITTERLLLRELRVSDFDLYAEHMTDPVALQYMTPLEDRRAAWRLFSSLTGTWMLTGAGWWAIELHATGETVGIVGGFFRETTLGFANAPLELGWSVYRPFWRRGFGREAAAAALAAGFARHAVSRAIAHIHPMNVASIRVSEAIGMHCEGEVDFYGGSSVRYAITRGAQRGASP
jgi:RimJ/RimL family protein N-acetyltransferase